MSGCLMLKVSDKDQLSIVKRFVTQNLDANIDLPVILERLEKGVLVHSDIFVDSLDSMTCLFIAIYPPDARGTMTYIRLLSTDNEKLLKLLQTIDKIDYTSTCFIGEEHSTDYLLPTFGENIKNHLVTYMYSLKSLQEIQMTALPPGYKVAADDMKLSEKEYNFIYSKWPYSNPSTDTWFKRVAEKYESVVVYKDDELVSWMFEDNEGLFHHLYTMPEHRGKGVASFVVQEMSRRMFAKGRTPYCCVAEQNESGKRFFAKLGFKRVGTHSRNYYYSD